MNELFYEPERFGNEPNAWLAEGGFELFCEDGHLSDAGLHALLNGRLDELGRLEAAEHLGFCTLCLERYTGLLTADVLAEPQTDLAPTVAWRLRKKGMRINLRRYAAVAAAAAVALALWGGGVFHQMAPQGDEILRPQPVAEPVRMEAPGAGVSGFVNGVLGAANEFCGGLLSRGWQKPAQEQPDTPQPKDGALEDMQGTQRPDPVPGPQADTGYDRDDAGEQHARWTAAQNQKPARTPATAMRGEE